MELNYPSTSFAASLSPFYGSVASSEIKISHLLEDEVVRLIASALMVYLGKIEFCPLTYLISH